jgi:hypothetical protein
MMNMNVKRAEHEAKATVAKLLAIGRRCAAILKGPAIDHAALL